MESRQSAGVVSPAGESWSWSFWDSLPRNGQVVEYSGGSLESSVELSQHESVVNWLQADHQHGHIRVWLTKNSKEKSHNQQQQQQRMRSELIPCSVDTTVFQLSDALGLLPSNMFVQLYGDRCYRLTGLMQPLLLQNQILLRMGVNDPSRVQALGCSWALSYLVRFFAGNPGPQVIPFSCPPKKTLRSVLLVRKGGLLDPWQERLCVLSGNRLAIYKGTEPISGESRLHYVTRANVARETTNTKINSSNNQETLSSCLKVALKDSEERCVYYFAFRDEDLLHCWESRLVKASSKNPNRVDLSHANVDSLPMNLLRHRSTTVLNLRHNCLQAPFEDRSHSFVHNNGLSNIHSLSLLTHLNLSDNHLLEFPDRVCSLMWLEELNLSTNRLIGIPTAIGHLTKLQKLHLHNNSLSFLPEEICSLEALQVLTLAFNEFQEVPCQLGRMRSLVLNTVSLAGNAIQDFCPSEKGEDGGPPGDGTVARNNNNNITKNNNNISKKKQTNTSEVPFASIQQLDLSMNMILIGQCGNVDLQHFPCLTHVDISHNVIMELNLDEVSTLQHLNCSFTGLTHLRVNGTSLRILHAEHNNLHQVDIFPSGDCLMEVHLQHNKLRDFPFVLCRCFNLEVLIIHHNLLEEIPTQLFQMANPRLKVLEANHNHLMKLPSPRVVQILKRLLLHSNKLTHLPSLLLQNCPHLKLLNLSHNRLKQLAPLQSQFDTLRMTHLLAAFNRLTSVCLMETVCRYRRLKSLDLSHNCITELQESFLSALPQLETIRISHNQMTQLPASLNTLSHLEELSVHSNRLSTLPSMEQCSHLKVLDASCNDLTIHESLTHIVSTAALSLLDVSFNSKLRQQLASRNSVPQFGSNKCTLTVDVSRHSLDLSRPHDQPSLDWPFRVKLSRAISLKKKCRQRVTLCHHSLRLPFLKEDTHQHSQQTDAFHGCTVPGELWCLFDGAANDEIAQALNQKVLRVFQSEWSQCSNVEDVVKHTMFTLHLHLKDLGKIQSASAAICFMCPLNLGQSEASNSHTGNGSGWSVAAEPVSTSQSMLESDSWLLTTANVGDVRVFYQPELTDISAMSSVSSMAVEELSRWFHVLHDDEERHRVWESGGFITDAGLVNGVTPFTRLLGGGYLQPQIVPEPHVHIKVIDSQQLRQATLLIVNRGLHSYVQVEEMMALATSTVPGTPRQQQSHEPAKYLVDMAQSYGSEENIGVLVVQLQWPDPTSRRFRPCTPRPSTNTETTLKISSSTSIPTFGTLDISGLEELPLDTVQCHRATPAATGTSISPPPMASPGFSLRSLNNVASPPLPPRRYLKHSNSPSHQNNQQFNRVVLESVERVETPVPADSIEMMSSAHTTSCTNAVADNPAIELSAYSMLEQDSVVQPTPFLRRTPSYVRHQFYTGGFRVPNCPGDRIASTRDEYDTVERQQTNHSSEHADWRPQMPHFRAAPTPALRRLPPSSVHGVWNHHVGN